MNKVTASIAVLIYILIGFFFFAASVHGPNALPYFTAVYLFLALAATWIIYSRIERKNPPRKTFIFAGLCSGIAVLLAGLSFGSLIWLSDWENYSERKMAANTEVLNMQDELLLSPAGNPIGVRLKYSMRFPKSDYFSQLPNMSPQEYLNISILADMRSTNQHIDPPMLMQENQAPKFEKGKTYNFAMDMLPNFIGQDGKTKKTCVIPPQPGYVARFNEIMADANLKIKYVVSISETNYAVPLNNLYSLKTFYDSVIKEGALPCPNV
jgi:hypothetical protein